LLYSDADRQELQMEEEGGTMYKDGPESDAFTHVNEKDNALVVINCHGIIQFASKVGTTAEQIRLPAMSGMCISA
jgi:hypothetical protein